MLVGRFGDTTGSPYLEGHLLIPRLGLRSNISFLLDTGADTTTLMPADARTMGVDYPRLTPSKLPSIGIGGSAKTYTEHALVLFTGSTGTHYAYRVKLVIVEPDQSIMKIPSLLGRDVLSQCRINCSYLESRLTLEVLQADYRSDS